MTTNAQNPRPDDLARLQRSPLGLASLQAARQHVAARRYAQGVTGYQNLLKQYSGAALLWLELANAAWLELDFSLAGQACQRAFALAPADAAFYASLGNLSSRM